MRDFILLFGLIIITDRKVKISNFSVDFLVSVYIKGNGIILLGIFLPILKIWVLPPPSPLLTESEFNLRQSLGELDFPLTFSPLPRPDIQRQG